MIFTTREHPLNSEEQARPQNSSKILRICNLIAKHINPIFEDVVIAGRREKKRRAFEHDVLMWLLLDHSAKFILVREDDRK